MVPPTLAPKPGPGGHDHRERGHRGHDQQCPVALALAPAQQDAAEPGRAEDPGRGVDDDRVVAQAVEPAGLQHIEAERRLQHQPRPGHEAEPDHAEGDGCDHPGRAERIAPPRPGQGDGRHRRGPRHGQRIQNEGGVPQRPPRGQAGQERPGRQRGRPGRGGPGHVPEAGTAPRLLGPAGPRARPGDQRDEGEERRVAEPDQLVEGGDGVAVDLGRGVLGGQRAQRGGEAARPGRPGPVHRAQRRADDRRRDRRAEPAQHGGGQVGQQHHPRLAGGGRRQQPAGVARPAHHDRPQMGLRPVTRRRDDQRRAGRPPGHDAAQLPVGRTGGRRPGGLPGRARRGGEVAEVDDGERAAGQGGHGQRGHRRQVRGHPAVRARQGERGSGPDRGGAPAGSGRPRSGGEQAPLRVVVELGVVADQARHPRYPRGQRRARVAAGRLDGDGGGHRARTGGGVRDGRPGSRVQRQPAVGRAGAGMDPADDKGPDRPLAGQAPERRGDGG